jgi:hypothetical protein
MRTLLAAGAAAAVLTAGCGAAETGQRPRHTAAPSFVIVSGRQACQRLLADMTRNGGQADIDTLSYIAGHSNVPRMAADARVAVQDLAHTGSAPIALELLRRECAKAGIAIPAS